MSIQRNRIVPSLLVVALAATLSASPDRPAGAAPDGAAASTAADAPFRVFPTTIALPDGFQPEGIAIGARPFAYFGSLADGSIYRADLVTGRGRVISPGPGTPSVGLKLDRRGRLFVSGGAAGDARVVSASTGEVLASYQFASAPTFVNDVVVTPDAAWFTDSLNPVLYQLPLGRRGGLPAPDDVVTVPLTGDLVFQAGFNTNGISSTPDGRGLLVVQSNTGLLFRVDPASGVTTQVDLGGQTLPNGDGLLLQGRTLYVVQNQLNQLAVVRLNRSGTSGHVVERVTDPRFDVPTTVAAFGHRLYLPNARFTTPPTPTTPYDAVAIRRP
ncbi:MAG: SMP-30/gluconolactonase/LRE family protein [Acidimicrobiales bacterium]